MHIASGAVILTPLSGVPQGSVVDSLLFVAYINIIDTILNNVTVRKNEDDIKLYLVIKRTTSEHYRSFVQPDVNTIQQ